VEYRVKEAVAHGGKFSNKI